MQIEKNSHYFHDGEIPSFNIGTDSNVLTEDEIIQKIDFDKNPISPLAGLSCLPVRIFSIIKMRFGLADGCEKTFEEIAEILNLTREKVVELESKGLDQLRSLSHCSTNQQALVLHGLWNDRKFLRKKKSAYIPPTLEALEGVYSFVPDAHHDQKIRSLEPSSFALNGDFTTRQKQWLYALRLLAPNQNALKKYLTDHIFPHSSISVAHRMSRLTGELFLGSYQRKDAVWHDVAAIGLADLALKQASERSSSEKNMRLKLKKESKETDSKLSVVYSFFPNDKDVAFIRYSEPDSLGWEEGDSWRKLWIYKLFLVGSNNDEKWKQELIECLANTIYHCNVSNIEEIAACVSEKGRQKMKDKYPKLVGHDIPRVDMSYKREKNEVTDEDWTEYIFETLFK